MAQPRSFAQKWLLEIRFEQRPSMFWLGAELADRWIDDFPELEVTMPNYRLNNKANFRLVQFGFNNAVLDIEGVKDIDPFIKLAQRLASDLVEVVAPTKIMRIGMRQINLVTGPPLARSLAAVREAFGFSKLTWDAQDGQDTISDIGIIVNFGSGNFDGQLHFGPYLPGVNNIQNFVYGDHPELRSFRGGLIFNCDYGEREPDHSVLGEEEIALWIRQASTMSRARIEKVRRLIYPVGE